MNYILFIAILLKTKKKINLKITILVLHFFSSFGTDLCIYDPAVRTVYKHTVHLSQRCSRRNKNSPVLPLNKICWFKRKKKKYVLVESIEEMTMNQETGAIITNFITWCSIISLKSSVQMHMTWTKTIAIIVLMWEVKLLFMCSIYWLVNTHKLPTD